ncbi:hypothetical protein K439DRAFT_1663790 [Ramaria rubella]|nr:hypothetical protein K439DRAFT_1663790 [Ramaria rubella]
MLDSRSKQTGQLSDLAEAILLHRDALVMQPEPHPARVIPFNNLAGTLRIGSFIIQRLGITSENAFINPLEAKVDHPRQKAVEPQWSVFASPCTANLSSLLGAVDLVEIGLAAVGLDLESRQPGLASNTDGLVNAHDAAAYALRCGQVAKAIEFLEAGRAIFWSQALHLPTPLDDLDAVKPDLAQKLQNISRALELGALRDVSRPDRYQTDKVVSLERQEVHYRQLNEEWEVTVEQVRNLDGFQYFLRPKPFAALSAAAVNGPVVILNAGPLNRCLTILSVVVNSSLLKERSFSFEISCMFASHLTLILTGSFPPRPDTKALHFHVHALPSQTSSTRKGYHSAHPTPPFQSVVSSIRAGTDTCSVVAHIYYPAAPPHHSPGSRRITCLPPLPSTRPVPAPG